MKRAILILAAALLSGSAVPASAEISFKESRRHQDTVSSARYYFVGITDPGNKVTMDGEQVKVYKTGTFGKEYKLAKGDNTINIRISNGKESIDRSMKVFFQADRKLPEKKYTLNEAKEVIESGEMKEKHMFVETVPGTYLQYGTGGDRLGGSKMGYLNEGIVLKVTGEIYNLYRVQLSENRFAFVSKDEVRPTTKMTRTVNTNNMSVFNNGKSDRISISLPDRLPYVTWTQQDPTVINVDIYGAMNNSNWITQRRDLGMIEYVNAEQVESDLFRLVVKLKEKYSWGYSVNYNGNTLQIDVKHAPENVGIKGMVIGLDAGHGGPKSYGAVGATGLKEAEVNLSIVFELKKILEEKGARVVLSRKEDIGVDMSDRKKTFLDNNIDLMISIHNNAGGSPLVPMGTSTYYKHIVNRELAACLLDRMLELEGVGNYGLTGNFNFSLNAPTEYPNALVECLFMSSLPDEEMLADPSYHKKIAQKVALGLEDYLKKVKKAQQAR